MTVGSVRGERSSGVLEVSKRSLVRDSRLENLLSNALFARISSYLSPTDVGILYGTVKVLSNRDKEYPASKFQAVCKCRLEHTLEESFIHFKEFKDSLICFLKENAAVDSLTVKHLEDLDFSLLDQSEVSDSGFESLQDVKEPILEIKKRIITVLANVDRTLLENFSSSGNFSFPYFMSDVFSKSIGLQTKLLDLKDEFLKECRKEKVDLDSVSNLFKQYSTLSTFDKAIELIVFIPSVWERKDKIELVFTKYERENGIDRLFNEICFRLNGRSQSLCFSDFFDPFGFFAAQSGLENYVTEAVKAIAQVQDPLYRSEILCLAVKFFAQQGDLAQAQSLAGMIPHDFHKANALKAIIDVLIEDSSLEKCLEIAADMPCSQRETDSEGVIQAMNVRDLVRQYDARNDVHHRFSLDSCIYQSSWADTFVCTSSVFTSFTSILDTFINRSRQDGSSKDLIVQQVISVIKNEMVKEKIKARYLRNH